MNRTLLSHCVTALGVLAMTTGAALARDEVKPEQFLKAEEQLGVPRSRLYEYSRAALPLCSKGVRWSFGVMGYVVHPSAPKADADSRIREIVMQTTGAQPGEMVLLADQFKTPFARAGLQKGDRIKAVETGSSAEDVAVLQDKSLSLAEKLERLRELSNARLSAAPARRYQVTRGDQQFEVTVTAEPSCGLGMRVRASEYAYADASYTVVTLTNALLEKFNEEEVSIAVAHEASQILLGYTGTQWGALGAALLFGNMASIGQNTELKKSSPAASTLIQVDRLALLMLNEQRLAPARYAAFLDRQLAQDDSFFRPAYVKTRHVSKERREALNDIIAVQARGEPLPFPDALTAEQREALTDSLKQLREAAQTLPSSKESS